MASAFVLLGGSVLIEEREDRRYDRTTLIQQLTHPPLQHFLLSIQHAASLPDPSPAPHLYLAQLSTPEESLTHFSNALAILQSKLSVLERAKLGLDGSAGSAPDLEEEGELRRSASRALVGKIGRAHV